MTVAIIPALAEAGVALERAFAGRPLLVHSIEQARLSARITRIIAVTDDGTLARLAERAGAEVIAAAGAGDAEAAAAVAAQAVAEAKGEATGLCGREVDKLRILIVRTWQRWMRKLQDRLQWLCVLCSRR